MTYDEVIEKISTYIKFGSKLGLERMGKLMELLGNPQDDMNIIHVAGTNGKGSVCRFIYEMLIANGYSTGMYTSPFLERFTERMEVNGQEISAENLSICTEEVIAKAQEVISCGFESPTEFEIVTAIGFVFFKRMNVEYLVLEVGLGGRGDATNIIKKPLVSVITSISFDHMEYLGYTLAEIAAEKAGIVKPHVPMISQVAEPVPREAIMQVCTEKNAPFYDITSFEVRDIIRQDDHYAFGFKLESRCKGHSTLHLEYSDVVISMIGQHQITNAVTALSAIEILRKGGRIVLKEPDILRGLRFAILKGRFEILSRKPFVVIDGAHNEAGAIALRNVIDQHFKDKRVLTVMGILKDKAADSLFAEMASFTDMFIATMPENPRGMEAVELAEKLAQAGKLTCAEKQMQAEKSAHAEKQMQAEKSVHAEKQMQIEKSAHAENKVQIKSQSQAEKPCIIIPKWKDAVIEAVNRRFDYDIVIFTGSLYLIGDVRGYLTKNYENL